MKSNIAAALIIALGLIVGGFLAGGRYSFAATEGGSVARLDRYTGTVAKCIPGTKEECAWLLDEPPYTRLHQPPDDLDNLAANEVQNSN